MGAFYGFNACCFCGCHNCRNFSIGISHKSVYRDNDWYTKCFYVFDVANQVCTAVTKGINIFCGQVLSGDTAMHLERPRCGDDNRCVGGEPGTSTFDIEELLCAQVSTKAGFGDHIVCKL